ncbi:nitrate reductase [Parvibaculaceae bacterium PLY_AMNH_Bact1]|nr:nitrate reductase [Parvibaculaceae bacterium PLY_AMNH_Bact1]
MTAGVSVKTTCPYCGVGCGVIARQNDDGGVEVSGDPDHPANFGKLCSKGSALGDTFSLEDRLLTPTVRGQASDWDSALDRVAQGFSQAVRDHGPDSVAFYVSGQLLTEDYYVANKLMKGFIGSGNIDTNSRLCMASSVAGHKRAFGSDTVPGAYEDLDEADLVVLVGSNFAWCHPVLFQRLVAAKQDRGSRIVVIDPRQTATTEMADMHLPLHPGSDVALFNGLLGYLADKEALDASYISMRTEGFDVALDSAKAMNLAAVAEATHLDPIRLTQFYQAFCETEKVVTVYSQGVNQSSVGTDKVNAIINCHLATGRIGREGMGPFSITGQPNAMGGREVGGLANQLAAHMSFEDQNHRDMVGRFWDAPNLAKKPGLKAVDLFDRVASGDIKALWIMATNPAASMPDADRVLAAIEACPFVVVSDVTDTTKTAALAHVLLPAMGWGEKDGTVTNSERRISRQRSFVEGAGSSQPDWWIISEVAQRMGFYGFSYENPAEIFREHAALSAFENDGNRDFDLSGLLELSDEGYEALKPIQWPVREGAEKGTKRLFEKGGFYTKSRKANFVAVSQKPPATETCATYPLILNSGRIRDQWHTMTRTGQSARLSSHIAEPFVEMHSDDARSAGIWTGDVVRIESARGSILARASVTHRQSKGAVFVPIHWTAPYSTCAEVDALVASNTDPVSGQPELKFTPVRAERAPMTWHAFLVSVHKPDLDAFPYWALARTKSGWRAEIAGDRPIASFSEEAGNLFGMGVPGTEPFSYDDGKGGGSYMQCTSGKLSHAVFWSGKPVEVARAWLVDQLGREQDPGSRCTLLAGRAGADQPDVGAIVCSCFDVGANQITQAMREGAHTIDAVGAALNAGTNCGSCRSEIGRLLVAADMREAV